MRVLLGAPDDETTEAIIASLNQCGVDEIDHHATVDAMRDRLSTRVELGPEWELGLLRFPAEATSVLLQSLRSVESFRFLPVVCVHTPAELDDEGPRFTVGANAALILPGEPGQAFDAMVSRAVGFWRDVAVCAAEMTRRTEPNG
ncbi:MAG: hypothetical protein AAGI30_03000 [Planctomycetota bacterium]